MKIDEAIVQLEAIRLYHGNIEVYFDCPKCGLSFTPSSVIRVATHLTEKKDE